MTTKEIKKIKRIKKIKNYRVFRDFTWNDHIPEFNKLNIIYGQNGSGKTTLSSLFKLLEDGQNISEGEVEFEFDNNMILSGSEILSRKNELPSVKVFNRDFIEHAVKAIDKGDIQPIFFLGEENIEKQEAVNVQKQKLNSIKQEQSKTIDNKKAVEKTLDSFCVQKAKHIKDELLGSKEYASYDKRSFIKTAAMIILGSESTLTPEEKQQVRKQKDAQAKREISKISCGSIDITQLYSKTITLLKRSIISNVLDDILVTNPQMAVWVQTGLGLHTDSDTCQFCGNAISQERRAKLESHFNDELKKFQNKVKMIIENIQSNLKMLESIKFPDDAYFYGHLVERSKAAVKKATTAIDLIKPLLSSLEERLNQKYANPFEQMTIEFTDILTTYPLVQAIDEANKIIHEHNEFTNNLEEKRQDACRKLERNYVVEFFPEYTSLQTSINESNSKSDELKEEYQEIENAIQKIEKEIIEHRIPAEELNAEIQNYLGHDELQLKIKETGYELTRKGSDKTVTHLSEGERTAIAFLYFLKSLKDKKFNSNESKFDGIIVIDDPVSSLDTNSLFLAFGYMQEHTKECNQLIISTHNFAFFRQVKNWFDHANKRPKKNEPKPSEFFMLKPVIDNGQKVSKIMPLHNLLRNYESEYHYLFSMVYKASSANNNSSESFYGLQNMGRRLLEYVFAFKQPDETGDLFTKLTKLEGFDSAKKVSIIRFANTYSHNQINELGHDLSVVAETTSISKCILELIEHIDKDHYKRMEKLVNESQGV